MTPFARVCGTKLMMQANRPTHCHDVVDTMCEAPAPLTSLWFGLAQWNPHDVKNFFGLKVWAVIQDLISYVEQLIFSNVPVVPCI